MTVGLGNITVKTYDRTAEDLYVDKPLTNVSVKYKNAKFLAPTIVPVIPVVEDTGYIWAYGTENFAIKDMQRADGAQSKSSSYSVSATDTYAIINYALKDIVTPKMRKQAANPMTPDTDSTEYLTEVLGLNKEYLLASALFNTGATGFSGYTETLNAASTRYRWDDYTNSTPLQDAAYAKEDKIENNSGATDNIDLLIGRQVWTYLKNHPDILERITYTQRGLVTTQICAELMEVDNLYVGRARYNTANEGQTASLSPVWGKFALFYHNPPRAALKTAACAVTVHGGNQVRKWNDPSASNGDWIEVEEAFQHKLLSAKSGYLFSTVIT